MATPRINKKLAALNKEICEEHSWSNLAQKSKAPRSQEDYITQVFEEIQGRVTRQLCRRFNRTENRILCLQSHLDDFLPNSYFKATPEPLPRRPGRHTTLTREQMRTIPKVIFILKRASLRVRRDETLAQKMIKTCASCQFPLSFFSYLACL